MAAHVGPVVCVAVPWRSQRRPKPETAIRHSAGTLARGFQLNVFCVAFEQCVDTVHKGTSFSPSALD